MPTGYISIIMEATGCSSAEADRIEELMRDDIFHSTLDWQTREELEEAARLAARVLRQVDRSSSADHISASRPLVGRDSRVEITLRLSQSQRATLGAALWTIPETVPGLSGLLAEWVPPGNYYLTLSGSRRAVARAARTAGFSQDEIREALRNCVGPRP